MNTCPQANKPFCESSTGASIKTGACIWQHSILFSLQAACSCTMKHIQAVITNITKRTLVFATPAQFLVRDIPGKPGEREVGGVAWRFNAWGGLVDGLYKDWRYDQQVAISSRFEFP